MPSEKSFKQRRTFGEFPAKGRGGAESLTPSAGFLGPFRASSLGRAAGAPAGQAGGGCPRCGGGIGEAGRGQISLRALQIPTPGPVPADSGGGEGESAAGAGPAALPRSPASLCRSAEG